MIDQGGTPFISEDHYTPVGGGPLGEQLKIIALSVEVQNPTAQWLLVDETHWIPPGGLGVVRNLPERDMAAARWAPPPGVVQPAAIAGQRAKLTYYTGWLAPSPGIATGVNALTVPTGPAPASGSLSVVQASDQTSRQLLAVIAEKVNNDQSVTVVRIPPGASSISWDTLVGGFAAGVFAFSIVGAQTGTTYAQLPSPFDAAKPLQGSAALSQGDTAVNVVFTDFNGPYLLTNPLLNVYASGTFNGLAATGRPPAGVGVGAVSGPLLAANASRKGLIITNLSANVVSLGLDGNAAILNQGISLPPNASWTMSDRTFTAGAIAAIASAGPSNVAIQEFV